MASKTTDWRPGPTVCRCCLSEGCYKDISTEYFWMGKREVYAEMLSETFSLSIAYSQSGGPNSNSRLICEICISKLRDASDFRRQVQECEKTFMQYLDPGSSVVELDVPTLEPIDTQVKVERVKLEMEASDDDFDDRADFRDADDDDDDLDDQPLTRLASKVPKKESVDLLDLLDNAKAGEKRKSTSKAKTPAAKKTKPKKEAKATSSKAPKPEKKKKGEVGTSDTRTRISALIIISSTSGCPFRREDWQTSYQCFYCDNKYATFPELEQHSATAHLSHKNEEEIQEVITGLEVFESVKVNFQTFTCKICMKQECNFKELITHLVLVHKKPLDLTNNGVFPIQMNEKYTCCVCEQSFDTFTMLSKHFDKHSLQIQCRNLICEHCGQKFNDKRNLSRHILSHTNFSLKVSCETCGDQFTSEAKARAHVFEAHSILTKEQAQRRPPPKAICETCGKVFASSTVRNNHILEVHLKRKRKKPSPEDSTKDKRELQRTQTANELANTAKKTLVLDALLEQERRNAISKEQQKRRWRNLPKDTCETCGKVFANKEVKKIHFLEVHLGRKRNKCIYCPETFRDYKLKVGHMISAHGFKAPEHMCSQCPKIYTCSGRLSAHVRYKHMNLPKYMCQVCKKPCTGSSSLKNHMLTHTGEKNFECTVCKKKFGRKCTLTEHMRIHNNDRRYVCQFCGQAFVQKCSLKGHMKTHHSNEVDYQQAGTKTEAGNVEG